MVQVGIYGSLHGYRRFPLFPVLPGGDAVMGFEAVGEVIDVRKTALQGNGKNTAAAGFKEFSGVL